MEARGKNPTLPVISICTELQADQMSSEVSFQSTIVQQGECCHTSEQDQSHKDQWFTKAKIPVKTHRILHYLRVGKAFLTRHKIRNLINHMNWKIKKSHIKKISRAKTT